VLANKVLNAGYAVRKKTPQDRRRHCVELPQWHGRVVANVLRGGLALFRRRVQALLRNALADPYLPWHLGARRTGAVAVTILGLWGGAICLSIRGYSSRPRCGALPLGRVAGAGSGAVGPWTAGRRV